LTGRSAIGR